MGLLFWAVLGIAGFNGDSLNCIEALHQLRVKHQLEIKSSVVIQETVIYTLHDRYGFKNKSAQIGCGLPEE